ncbi:MAG: cation transporter [Leptolyngbyaceae cyanobacterium CRU_2_3]|nr:cation transporter [Leptolyngbyaceae cyanobacterium CRU_2_3]
MGDLDGRYRASYQVLFVTLWLTLLVLAVKFWASWTTRSLSLAADLLHTLLDCFSIILSVDATDTLRRNLSQELRTHTKHHTAVVLLFVAVLGFMGSLLLAVCGFHLQAMLTNPLGISNLQVNPPLILLLGLVVGVHLCLVLFERYESTLLGNPALRHNANHILQNIWLTILMLMGLVGSSRGYTWLDPLMAIFLTLMLIPSLWRILSCQLPSLTYQMAIAPEILHQIAIQLEGVSDCYEVRSQGVLGRQISIQMYLLMHPEFMGVAHLIGERLENILRERYGVVRAKIYVRELSGKSQRWQDSLNLRQKTKGRKPTK